MDISVVEWLNILFFSSISMLAWFIPAPLHRRIIACTIGAFGITVCLFMAGSPAFLPAQTSRILRNWLPMMLILVAYYQSGQLFIKPWLKFQAFLLDLDRRLLGRFYRGSEVIRVNSFLSGYFEISYLACYPLIPAALGVLTLLSPQDGADEFWLVVLTSSYACYALIPFFPAFPPRLLNTEPVAPIQTGRSRALNEWILRYASIQANTFPSAHVASCIAASLVLLRYDTLVGAGFLCVSLSIAVAVVIRRYHYAADAILGIAFPFIPFLLTA